MGADKRGERAVTLFAGELKRLQHQPGDLLRPVSYEQLWKCVAEPGCGADFHVGTSPGNHGDGFVAHRQQENFAVSGSAYRCEPHVSGGADVGWLLGLLYWAQSHLVSYRWHGYGGPGLQRV